MSQDKDSGSDYPSPEDMQAWLAQEIRDSAKAHELRIREAVELVTDYALGKLSPEESADKYCKYIDRWGEALFGAATGEGMNDEDILKGIDTARSQLFSRLIDSKRKSFER